MRGTVKLYSLVKGAGIIIGEDKKEYSVKLADIEGTGLRRLHESEIVNFTADGLKAKKVTTAKGDQ